MIYFAIALILVGLLFLVKALSTPSGKTDQHHRPPPVAAKEQSVQQPVHSQQQIERLLERSEAPHPLPPSVPTEAGAPLMMTGKFYLDYDQSLRNYNNQNVPLPASHYLRFRRVGTSQLVVKPNVFEIYSGNVSHSYPTDELSQISFRDKYGIALIPLSANQPIAVFLTSESALLKQYLKKHVKLADA